MKPLKIYQGADETIDIETNIDLSTATEIEVTIDTPTQIIKTLTGAHISAVTATQFTLAIDAADTETVKAGGYKYQCRATIAGKIKQGQMSPNKILIEDSVFVSLGSGNDYGD